jgi:hypothetical protein
VACGKCEPRCGSGASRRRLVVIAWLAAVIWSCDTADVACAQPRLDEAGSISIAVSDAWMAHLVREEHRALVQQRWFAGGGFSLAAVGWGVGLTLRQRSGHQSPLSGVLLSGAIAASAGFAAASLWITDPNTAALVVNLGGVAEFVMASHALTLLTNRGCQDDCFLQLSADSTTALGSALVALLTYAFYRPVRVSAHYAAYTRLPRTSARAAFALRLLEEQEWRQRRTDDISLVYALAFSVAYGIAATQARTTSGRIVLGASGGALALYQSISYLLALLSDKPSERLRANLMPP